MKGSLTFAQCCKCRCQPKKLNVSRSCGESFEASFLLDPQKSEAPPLAVIYDAHAFRDVAENGRRQEQAAAPSLDFSLFLISFALISPREQRELGSALSGFSTP